MAPASAIVFISDFKVIQSPTEHTAIQRNETYQYANLYRGILTSAIPCDPEQIVTMLELAMGNMLERDALRELLFDKGIIIEVECVARFEKLDR